MRKIFLLILILVGFSVAKISHIHFFSIGVRIFPSKDDIRFYVETSCWVPFAGVDTGIEIGRYNIELYGEAETGIGVLGYSHGLYYGIPYGFNNYYGWRGRFWAGMGYYASFDLDYTKELKGFGTFISLPTFLYMFNEEARHDFCNEHFDYFYCRR